MGINQSYKNSLFTLIFNDADVLRELYGALCGIDIPPDTPVEINTLQDVLFMDRINDISFKIGDKLIVLIEHQSTINPNMALRLLMYAARVYEKIIDNKSLYKSTQIKIPKPEFYVLYNGTAPFPEEKTLKLSEMYENLEGTELEGGNAPSLELEVKALNINHGKNEVIERKCRTLEGYSIFVEKVRELQGQGNDLPQSVKQALVFCVSNGILKVFLKTHGSEVLNMLMTEWNWDDALAVRYEEGVEYGREKGWESGLARGKEEIARAALEKGIPPEMVYEITGLDIETITNLKQETP